MPIDEVKFDRTWTPVRYGKYSPDADGQWSELPGSLGTLWTDGADSLDLVNSADGNDTERSILFQLISDYKRMSAPASAVFKALCAIYNGSEPESGRLVDAPTADPLLAAADPVAVVATESQEIFAAFDDDAFIGVGMARVDGMYLRTGGTWAKLQPDDLRFDNTEWLPLDDTALAKYDEDENKGTELVRTDVES